MNNVTDMHCHILPDVDDGPETMEESIILLKEAEKQKVRCMIATPHYHPGRYMATGNTVLRKLHELRDACLRTQINIKLLPGHECYWFSGLIDALDRKEALTMNGSSFVLVEFEPESSYSAIVNAVRTLANNEYQAIIAHFERYRCLYGRTDRLVELKNMGAHLQMNFDRILDKDSLFRKNIWRRLILDGYVDFLGSDTHGMGFRPLHIYEAVNWLNQNMNEGRLWEILERNTGMLVQSVN